ncbi:MAG TPA: glutamate--tRNA ligase [Streptosporangiaceae bacterium]|nr:glutamate--tRNA ligase [Streptosporangiaceae bacterium]
MTNSPDPLAPVRVRFAPSPTGMFHVGSARSALYNWAFTKQRGGAFVLRIEDTDTSRNRPEWIDGIVTAMAWLGMDRSGYEGPVLQSANAGKHVGAARRLADTGHAYYCACTREEIVTRTGDQHRGYDGYCRDLGLGPGPGRALRFRTPDEGVTIVDDVVRGKVSFENSAIDDFSIARADGSVLFLLANVVDDLDMGITHVVRGEEHLPNTPKQQLMMAALGHQPPAWAHLPVLVNEKRQKLSKRRDKVALESYRDEGYLAEAMRNYLMLLGWAPSGNREILPWPVLVEEFRLDEVNVSPAFFDVKKLRAINGDYIRSLSVDEFIARSEPWLSQPAAPWRPGAFSAGVYAQVAPLVQTRVAVMSELTASVDFLFLDEAPHDETSWTKTMTGASAGVATGILDAVLAGLPEISWDADSIRACVEQAGAQFGLKLGKAQAPVRVAVTGRTTGLPLFESIYVFGRDATIDRLRAAQAKMRGASQ